MKQLPVSANNLLSFRDMNSGPQNLYAEELTLFWQSKPTRFPQIYKSKFYQGCLLAMMLYSVWRLISTNIIGSNEKLMG